MLAAAVAAFFLHHVVLLLCAVLAFVVLLLVTSFLAYARIHRRNAALEAAARGPQWSEPLEIRQLLSMGTEPEPEPKATKPEGDEGG